MLIINAKIITMEQSAPPGDCIRVEQGIIQEIGALTPAPEERVMDAGGGWVLPGFVDAHTHLGLFEDSIGFEGEDGNEDSDPITPHLRVIDAINPLERSFSEALHAGVTSCLVSPGSSNPIAGQIAAIKTYGRRIDDMIIKAPCAMKFALGENPKSCYHDKEEAPVTRMATAAFIREALYQAVEYGRKVRSAEEDGDLPEYDIKHESLQLVLNREIQAHFHAHRADDIFTALRIAKEFSLDAVILHGTEAYRVADLLKEEPNIRIINGPFMTDRSKPELAGLTEQAPAILTREGIPTSISTDHPETPLKYLKNCALTAVQHGMDAMDALRAITIVPACIAGIDDRVGSIKVGKDADLILFNGDPFDYKTKICAVFAGGQLIDMGGSYENH